MRLLPLILLLLAGCARHAATPSIISAAEWGSKPQPIPDARRHTPRWITIHHAGVPWKETDDPLVKIRNLQAWGQREKKWPDLPYHYLIAPDGRIFAGREVAYEPESNTKYDLTGNIGIQLWGDFEQQAVSEAQLRATVTLTAWLCDRHGIDAATVRTHRDVADTTCPGRDLYRFFASRQFHQWVMEEMRGKTAKIEMGTPTTQPR